MDKSLAGAIKIGVVTALPFKISCRMFSKFRLHVWHILEDGSVVAGGHPGGDCSSLQDQLRNVRQIAAAILSDGSLVGATQTVEVTAQRFKSSLRI